MVSFLSNKQYPADFLKSICVRAKQKCIENPCVPLNPVNNPTDGLVLKRSFLCEVIGYSRSTKHKIWCIDRVQQKQVIDQMARLKFIKVENRKVVRILN